MLASDPGGPSLCPLCPGPSSSGRGWKERPLILAGRRLKTMQDNQGDSFGTVTQSLLEKADSISPGDSYAIWISGE